MLDDFFLKKHYLISNLVDYTFLNFSPSGNLLAASGPLVFFFFFPTLVGIGGSYFFFLSFNYKPNDRWENGTRVTKTMVCNKHYSFENRRMRK